MQGGGGKGGKVGTKWKFYMETCMFLYFHVQKHKNLHVFSPFNAPHYIIMVKGLLVHACAPESLT